MFGNVNVDYKPCKSHAQLKRSEEYILGRQSEQLRDGVVKTADNLYWGINCDRDNFQRDVMVTRELFGKKKSKNAILAHKLSISFHPDDNEKISYSEAFKIAKEFAEKFMKDYEVLFAVHTDTEHIHVHFLIGNCNTETGKAFRRSRKDLYEMSEFFGQQCAERGFLNSVRENYYGDTPVREKLGERQMKAMGKETFKDELREVIIEEIADKNNHTLEDVVNALMRDYNVECRVRGNTISYKHPNFTDKSGKPASVRGKKLGEKFTVKGINNELDKKRTAERETGSSIYDEGCTETRCLQDFKEVSSTERNANSGSAGAFITGASGRNAESVIYEKGNSRRGESGQAGINTAVNSTGNRKNTRGLYEEYARKVRRNERESAEAAERRKRVQKRRGEESR